MMPGSLRLPGITFLQSSDDADALLDNPALGSNPDVIRLLYQVSRLLDEAPLHQEGAAAPSPAEEAGRPLDYELPAEILGGLAFSR